MDSQQIDPQPIDPHWVALDTLTVRAERNRAEMARLQAERAELCAEGLALVADRVAQREAAHVTRRGRELGDDIPLRELIAELGAALRVGDQTVRGWLGNGAALTTQYRATLEALRAGHIDERHASAIIDGGMAIVEDDVRAEYESMILLIAESESAARVRAIARVIAGRLQPDVVDDRLAAAARRRFIRLIDLEDGLSRLLIDGPTALAHAAFDRLTEMARAVDGDGCAPADPAPGTETGDTPLLEEEGDVDDPRTIDQRRTDIAFDLLLGGTPTAHGDALAAIRGSVQVTIPVLTLAGLSDEPAVLAGHGPIDSDTARRLAAVAPGWDRVFIDPVTGEPLTCDRYDPHANLRRFIFARDEHCRWPGCLRTPRRCDVDHTLAYADGGKTAASNLSLLCRRHHRLKHASPWTVRQRGHGSLEFTSPTGRTYRNDAPPVVQFVRQIDKWRVAFDPADAPEF